MKKILIFFTLFFSSFLYSQEIKIDKIEPPNWWSGMEWNKVQLMVYGENLKDINANFDNEKLKILKVYNAENPNYLFIDIEIPGNLDEGEYNLILKNEVSERVIPYTIFKKNEDRKNREGFNSEDIIYLLMPDRFANGDTTNDIVEGYGLDLDRSNGSSRHGGDLQGVIDHLDYIKDLGFTAIWLNPVVENNNRVSYHGYGATDFYKVDPRLGTNELYKKLIEEAHEKGIKIILDHVANHIHINHKWMENLPFHDWINGSRGEFKITNHDKVALTDIYKDSTTHFNSVTGWFTDYMPDLNQRNPFMANYIIQNTLWWMEYADLDGIREDTYPYADPEFMALWAEAILKEYPNTNIVGEVWKGEPVFLSTYQEKSKLTNHFDTKLPAVTDFALSDAFISFLSGHGSLNRIYETLAMDFIYHNPENLVTFVDNHDIRRAMLIANENAEKVKIALQILLTTRGIPQIYYGTELAKVGGPDDGSKREDFPGGFPGDERNAFTSEGRTEKENDIFNLLKKVIEIRRENKALSKGKLIHFPPKENLYVFFRILDDERIMVIVNNNKEDKLFDLEQVRHLLDNQKKLFDLKSEKEIRIKESFLLVKANDVSIFKVGDQ